MPKSLKGKPEAEVPDHLNPDLPMATGGTQGDFLARNAAWAKAHPGGGGITEQPAFLGIPMGPEKRIR